MEEQGLAERSAEESAQGDQLGLGALSVEERTMLAEFVRQEGLRGRKSLRKLPYLLSPFLHYIRREGLTVETVGRRHAQNYQGFLATKTDADGRLHYRALTVADMIVAARRLYGYLRRTGRVASNPFTDIERVRCAEELPRNLPDERTMDALLTDLGRWGTRKHRRDRKSIYRLHVMAETLYASGLRIDELARLRVEDVRIASRTVLVREGKGGKERTAYLDEYAASVLELYLKRMRGLYCPSRGASTLFGVRNGRILEGTLNAHLKREAARFGLERFTAHAIRHTLGFHLLRRGCDLRYIQLILGHESLSATTLYTRVEKSDLRRQLDHFHPRGGG